MTSVACSRSQVVDSGGGDANGDGSVGVEDLLLVIAEWNCVTGCTADLTGDGIVDVSDLLTVIANWD